MSVTTASRKPPAGACSASPTSKHTAAFPSSKSRLAVSSSPGPPLSSAAAFAREACHRRELLQPPLRVLPDRGSPGNEPPLLAELHPDKKRARCLRRCNTSPANSPVLTTTITSQFSILNFMNPRSSSQARPSIDARGFLARIPTRRWPNDCPACAVRMEFHFEPQAVRRCPMCGLGIASLHVPTTRGAIKEEVK